MTNQTKKVEPKNVEKVQKEGEEEEMDEKQADEMVRNYDLKKLIGRAMNESINSKEIL